MQTFFTSSPLLFDFVSLSLGWTLLPLKWLKKLRFQRGDVRPPDREQPNAFKNPAFSAEKVAGSLTRYPLGHDRSSSKTALSEPNAFRSASMHLSTQNPPYPGEGANSRSIWAGGYVGVQGEFSTHKTELWWLCARLWTANVYTPQPCVLWLFLPAK